MTISPVHESFIQVKCFKPAPTVKNNFTLLQFNIFFLNGNMLALTSKLCSRWHEHRALYSHQSCYFTELQGKIYIMAFCMQQHKSYWQTVLLMSLSPNNA